MPEAPEVETTRRGLALFVEGLLIERVVVGRRDLRREIGVGFEEALTGAKVRGLGRHGKLLLWELERVGEGGSCSAGWGLTHLGMSGRILLREAWDSNDVHEHVRLGFEGGLTAAYRDPRRFGFWGYTKGDWRDHEAALGLGLDVMGDGFDASALGLALGGGRKGGGGRMLRATLLDQKAIAGLGNIYVCEAMWRARIWPWARAGGWLYRGGGVVLEELATAIVGVLKEATASGGSSLQDHRKPSGELGMFQHDFAVYGREGEECGRCGGRVSRGAVGGRGVYYCGGCQRRGMRRVVEARAARR